MAPAGADHAPLHGPPGTLARLGPHGVAIDADPDAPGADEAPEEAVEAAGAADSRRIRRMGVIVARKGGCVSA